MSEAGKGVKWLSEKGLKAPWITFLIEPFVPTTIISEGEEQMSEREILQ